MFKNYSLNRMLALVVTAGFAFLFTDTIIEHWPILKEDVPSFIPIVFCAAAFCIGVVTVMKWNDNWMRVFRMTLFASMIVAVAGVYYHVVEDDDDDEQKEQIVRQKTEQAKPLLAPFAFGGMAVIGLLGTARTWRAEVEEES